MQHAKLDDIRIQCFIIVINVYNHVIRLLFGRMWAIEHGSKIAIVAVCYLATVTQAIPKYSRIPPGPYCESRFPQGKCCSGRQDECSAPILLTTCYCDDFCNLNRRDDCCPDYWSYCRDPHEIKRNSFIYKNVKCKKQGYPNIEIQISYE